MSAFRMRVHWSYPYWRNIWYALQLFSRFLGIKKYSCIGMLSIAIFYIPRWRYLHITLDHIFSCCVSCNGLSIGIITIYLWNSLGNIFHQSLWKLKFKRTKQTESFFTGPESCRIDTCRSRPSRSDRLDRIEDPATLVCQSEVPWDPPPSERSRK